MLAGLFKRASTTDPGANPARRVDSGRAETPLQLRPVRWLIVTGCLLITAIAVATTAMIFSFRDRALDTSTRELSNTALLLARHFDEKLADFAMLQKDILGDIDDLRRSPGDVFEGRMSTLEMHEMLRAKVSGSSDVAGVNVFDADGNLINSSDAWPVRDLSIADRPYFKALKSGSADEFTLSLIKGRLTGHWTIVFARRIAGPGDEFLGVLTRGIAASRFETFFASIELEPGAAIAMFHSDGTMLARHPHADDLIGSNFISGPVHRQILAVSEAGAIRLDSPVDGLDRLAAARRLRNFPLAIVATTTISAALAGWREQTRLLTVAASLSALVVGLMLFGIGRQLVRHHEASRRQLDTAINNMTQGLVLYDAAARVVFCNRSYLDMFGLSPDIVKPGASVRDVIRNRKETGSFTGDVDAFCDDILARVARGETTHKTLHTGGDRFIQIVNKPLAHGGWVATMEDVTEQKRSEERIAHLAHYDSLTDLPNRALFRERLQQQLARVQRGERFALLYIDVDEFKGINDTLGHPVGDELLKALAARLKSCVRETDIVARLGGDEFAVIQTAITGLDDVTSLVTRLYDAIRQPYQCLEHLLSTDASIGIALAPQDGADLDQLIKSADLAMYGAKADGRRTYRFFEPAMDANAKARRALEQDLREAIVGGGFEVHYQPVVDLHSNVVTGCEALLRWRHPVRGMISPAEFIPMAEDTGLINQLGEFVLRTACAEAMTWPDRVRLAVNVSPVQFKSEALALKVAAALAASGLPARRLELEITEAVLIRDDAAALDILHQVREMGVRVALDDFGTGYSSLSYLQRFPFDKIKIDRCFVADIAKPEGTSPIVQAVVTIAAARRMTTTAEGVETAEQRDLLRTLGCTEMQGYLFSAAVSAEAIRELLSGHGTAAAAHGDDRRAQEAPRPGR